MSGVLGAGSVATGLGLTHKQQLLLASVANTPVPAAGQLFVALCVWPVNPDVDSGATISEVTWQGYQRAVIVAGVTPAGDWALPDEYGRIRNAHAVSFPPIVSAPAGQQAGWWALLDSPTVGAGTVRWAGPVPPLAVTPLDPVVTLPPGVLTIALV